MVVRPNRLEVFDVSHGGIPLIDRGFHIVKGGRMGDQEHDVRCDDGPVLGLQ